MTHERSKKESAPIQGNTLNATVLIISAGKEKHVIHTPLVHGLDWLGVTSEKEPASRSSHSSEASFKRYGENFDGYLIYFVSACVSNISPSKGGQVTKEQ